MLKEITLEVFDGGIDQAPYALIARNANSSIVILDLASGQVHFAHTALIAEEPIGTITLPLYDGTAYLDVDDILVDFHGMFNYFINETYKCGVPHDFKPAYHDYRDALPDGVTVEQAFKDLGNGWEAKLSTLNNAGLFTEALKALGARISLVTSINADQVPGRIRNLRSNGIQFDELFATRGLKKSEVIAAFYSRHKPYDIFVDDFLTNCIDIAVKAPDMHIISLHTPYNATYATVQGKTVYEAIQDGQIHLMPSVQDIYEATLTKVLSRMLSVKGMQDVKINPPSLQFTVNGQSITPPAVGCGTANACAGCPSRQSSAAR